MKEVKKCSISGVAFTLDSDAYDTLSAYLDSLKKSYKNTTDGAEIVADIEARIAELILSTHDNSRIVEKPLIDNIVSQMGSAEDITDHPYEITPNGEPRIPRRLYRDTENARLGGVCAGIGKYFDIDPTWVRLGLFTPILLSFFHWVPFLGWMGSLMGNLFGIFVICYFIMWFAVPAARTARQKLEMNGERITEQSIRDTTAAASNDADSKAKPIVAEAVSAFGKIILILLKIFAGIIVTGLILTACALILGIFAVGVGGSLGSIFTPEFLGIGLSAWAGCFGIFVVLVPVILLIYVLMCLIVSRKPSGKAILFISLLWLAGIIGLMTIAIRQNVWSEITNKCDRIETFMDSKIIVDSDTTSVRKFLEDAKIEGIVEEDGQTFRITTPKKDFDITIEEKDSIDGVKASIEVRTVKSSTRIVSTTDKLTEQDKE